MTTISKLPPWVCLRSLWTHNPTEMPSRSLLSEAPLIRPAIAAFQSPHSGGAPQVDQTIPAKALINHDPLSQALIL